MDKYYFYFDEGGLLGFAHVAITKKPILKTKGAFGRSNHPSNYFFGRIPLSSIYSHLFLFHSTFPKCTVIFDIANSDIIPKQEEWSIRHGM